MENADRGSAEKGAREKKGKESTRVEDVMTRRVITLSPDQSCADAVSLMAKYSFRHFPVVESPTRIVGVISDRDILRAMARTGNSNTSNVRQFMSREVVAVKPDTPLSVATGTMLSKRINCLPVVDGNGVLCGIITSTDLLKVLRSIQESVEKEHQ